MSVWQRYLKTFHDVVWTYRFGHPGAAELPWIATRLPQVAIIGLLIAWELQIVGLGWLLSHMRGDLGTEIIDALYLTLGAYYPMLLAQTWRRS